MIKNLDEWLNQVQEEALEPERPICDAHHHLWDKPASRYLIQDLVEDAADHNIVSTVFVECMASYREDGPEALKPVGETVYIDSLAAECLADPSRKMACSAAIISYADLRLGSAVTPVLEAHQAASPGRFRGTRHGVGWDEHPDVPNSHTKPKRGQLLDGAFREGVACLQKQGLLYECYLYHTQLLELADLARTFPELTIILNHLGGPLGVGPYDVTSDEVVEVWKRGVVELAACPNVVAKLGGIAMPRNGFGWHERLAPPTSEELAHATAPFYLHTIEQFGPARCMFESNFPVEKQSCSYTVLWNSFKRIAAAFSEPEKEALFRGTAERVYRIGEGT
jgi:predicted TIM-barrel fold metal-dependent hydrolase